MEKTVNIEGRRSVRPNGRYVEGNRQPKKSVSTPQKRRRPSPKKKANLERCPRRRAEPEGEVLEAISFKRGYPQGGTGGVFSVELRWSLRGCPRSTSPGGWRNGKGDGYIAYLTEF